MGIKGMAQTAVAVGDRLVPQVDQIVIRTPEVEDQALELVRALQDRGLSPVAWLVDDASLPHAEVPEVPVVDSWSLRGLVHYWRSRVVVHTHGAYGARRGASGKVFVNLWHGMPVKRLPPSLEYRRRTDLGIATAPVHARHLAETWGVPVDRVAITGLPRNDLLARPRPPRSAGLATLTGGRPIAIWLPTFRRSVVGELRVDGRDLGTASQLPGADAAAFDALMGELGMYGIMKPHPMAPRHDHQELVNSSTWTNADLAREGYRLYDLLAHADLLLTDHSSVWIDFLLTGRPMVFTIADLEEYRSTRGFYFGDMEGLLPGPIVEDLAGLRRVLPQVLVSGDPWESARREALVTHHLHTDAGSAARVAELVDAFLRGDGPVGGAPTTLELNQQADP